MNTENIKLIHGDFYSEYHKLEPGSFDLILTDPPYNRFQEAGQEWDVKLDWNRTEGIFAGLLKPNAWVIMFCDFPLAVELTNTFCHKLEFHGIHIWHKPGGSPAGKTQPLHDTEHILLFRKKGVRVSDMTFNPKSVLPAKQPYSKRNSSPGFSMRRQKKSAVNDNLSGERWVKTLIEGPSKPNMTLKERAGLSHPTVKPQAVLQPLLKCYSNPGDKILDPYGGVFSTALSGIAIGNRHVTSIEIDHKFFKEGEERIKRVLMQTTLEFSEQEVNR